MANKNIYFFVGTMAEYIKLSPIIKQFNTRKVQYKIIISGQSPLNLDELKGYTGKVKADIFLKPKSKKSSVVLFIKWALDTLFIGGLKLKSEFKNKNKSNTYFIIHGDTVSSLLGCLIAKYYGLSIVHIESGLRSYNFLEPFPEEICRYIIIHLADILFAPTDWAKNNLKGLKGKKVSTKYNTLIEPCLWALRTKGVPELLKKKNIGKYYILTMHRQEHILFHKNWTRKTLEFVFRNSQKHLNSVFTMHHLTEEFLKYNKVKEVKRKITVIPRTNYIDFMKLMNKAEYIATDGCTNQEEAYYMGLPLLALRHRTERIEGLNENVLIYNDDNIKANEFFLKYKKYRREKIRPTVKPSQIIVEYLLENN